MKERKARFNFFDVLIIAFAAVVCFAGYKYFSKQSGSSANVPEISYVVELPRKEADYQQLIEQGDDIHDAIKGGYYGKVADVRREKCTEVTEAAQTGEYVKAVIEDRYDYYITIKGTPTTFSDSDIMFASQKLKVGNKIYIKSKNYAGEGVVVDIDLGDAR